MSHAKVFAEQPLAVKVEQGKNYFWCACGLSQKQPFCDGSHASGDFSPVRYTAEKNETVYFCACKQSRNPPLCDGSHKKLRL